MLQMANIEFIKKQFHVLGKSIRQISKDSGYSRQSIRKALQSEDIPKYKRYTPRVSPVTDQIRAVVLTILENDANVHFKQRHTAKRIYDLLKQDYDFQGGESTVRRLVSSLKKKPPEAFVPMVYPPGEFAQFDWGDAYINLSGKEVKVQIFCMILAHSRKFFVKAFPHQRQEALLQGHVDAFEYFGAVPKTVTYDNLKTAVKRILEGRNREEQDAFIQLRSHYLFDSYFCEPAKGNQKGIVENLVKFARSNFLVPIPQVQSLEELNQRLLEDCDRYALQHIVPRTKSTIEAVYTYELLSMLPLPRTSLACHKMVPVKSNSLSMVQFEKNRYSVPVSHASHQFLWLKAYVNRIEILDRDIVIATHPRSYARDEEVLNYDHYLDLLLRRPGAVPYARALQQQALPLIYQEVLQLWKHRLGGMKDFVRILLLHRDYDSSIVEVALIEAKQRNLLQLDAIVQLVHQKATPEVHIRALAIEKDSPVPRVVVTRPNLAQYNQLTKRSVVH
jgi:transposase